MLCVVCRREDGTRGSLVCSPLHVPRIRREGAYGVGRPLYVSFPNLDFQVGPGTAISASWLARSRSGTCTSVASGPIGRVAPKTPKADRNPHFDHTIPFII